MADNIDVPNLAKTMEVTSTMPIATVRVWYDNAHTSPVAGAAVSVYTVDANFVKTLVASGTCDGNGVLILTLPARQGYFFHGHTSERVGTVTIYYDYWTFWDVVNDVTVDLGGLWTHPITAFWNTNLGLSKSPPLVVNDAVDVTIYQANYGAPGNIFARIVDSTAGKTWEKRAAVDTGTFNAMVISIIVPPPRGIHNWSISLGHEQ